MVNINQSMFANKCRENEKRRVVDCKRTKRKKSSGREFIGIEFGLARTKMSFPLLAVGVALRRFSSTVRYNSYDRYIYVNSRIATYVDDSILRRVRVVFYLPCDLTGQPYNGNAQNGLSSEFITLHRLQLITLIMVIIIVIFFFFLLTKAPESNRKPTDISYYYFIFTLLFTYVPVKIPRPERTERDKPLPLRDLGTGNDYYISRTERFVIPLLRPVTVAHLWIMYT